jgi:heme exporter protein C
MAWSSFVAFVTAGVASAMYLMGRRPRRDAAAKAAVELGLVFGVLATVSGSIWARIEWGAFWNWDPRQTTIVLALLFYAAYLALRAAVADHETRRRLAAGYAVLGLVVAPFLFFIAPRIAAFSLHPEPVINAEGDVKMDPAVLAVLVSGSTAFTALFFWVHSLQCRLAAVARRNGLEA